MPSTPRGRNAATLLAVVLTVALALAWLRSSDGGPPRIPVGLSVETVPAVTPEEPAAPDGAAPPTRGLEGAGAVGDRAARKPRKAERDERRERAGRAAKRGHAGRAAKRVPATRPAPSAGSRTGAGGSGGPAAPEFALE